MRQGRDALDMVDAVDAIANAVLYEGYLLYPYRQSAVKNQVRWTFGGIFPRSWSEATGGSEPWLQQTQCLLLAGDSARVAVTVRFLRLLECKRSGEAAWQEATERSLPLGEQELKALLEAPARLAIELAAGSTMEAGIERRWLPLRGEIEVAAEELAGDAYRLTVGVRNTTLLTEPAAVARDQGALQSMASTHAVLRLTGGEFISLADPPDELREAARECHNLGSWPVLVGQPELRDTLLASPIILEDYPRVAGESPTNLFDSTEIDELLTLRILTLTDDEKAQMRAGDEKARRLLERAEALSPEDLMRLHGAVRALRPVDSGER